ncbi:bifunctional nuclease family protein [Leifsonia flava]|nr:bifunctional nuclease family protein [Leifsonia flava]
MAVTADAIRPQALTGGVMVQVRILGVALDSALQHIILLKPVLDEPGEGRVVPIWVGELEATSILIATQGEEAPRPLTHDLMKTVLQTLGAEVERVDVTRIEDGTFYAEITLMTPSGRRVIDARPSDSLGLAARFHAPIWVADAVVEEAGIPAELVDVAEDEEKLEEFKEFLEHVDPEDFQG